MSNGMLGAGRERVLTPVLLAEIALSDRRYLFHVMVRDFVYSVVGFDSCSSTP